MNYNADANTDDGSCLYPCECDDVYDPVCAYDYLTGETVTFNNPCEAECVNAWVIWDGDCLEQPIYGCTDPEALNFNPDATDDDGSCVTIPVCGDDESPLLIEVVGDDSLIDIGLGVSLYWTLTTDLGDYVDLVYDYNEFQQATAYGCMAAGCYNFFVHDYGWAPGLGSVQVTIDGESSSYSVPEGQFEAAFAIGVETDGCEVTIPGCTDPEALNYHPTATVDDGSCQYPFVCEEGTAGQLYICTFSGGQNVGLDITADNGDVLFSQQGFDDLAIIYLDVCLEDSTCYTATLSDLSGEGLGWNGGYFWSAPGLSTSSMQNCLPAPLNCNWNSASTGRVERSSTTLCWVAQTLPHGITTLGPQKTMGHACTTKGCTGAPILSPATTTQTPQSTTDLASSPASAKT